MPGANGFCLLAATLREKTMCTPERAQERSPRILNDLRSAPDQRAVSTVHHSTASPSGLFRISGVAGTVDIRHND
ncbi:hypothetical protein EX30DRAFT_232786 [Ascodesmis nigricans]|uniref:Uncharacterized protein n=1 Tax=Ascodesmis nigricans TaxID=341454 RepID=A0A4S2MYU7_9PEZI|nr:hypothetical protein EX30DRAFT_232786 [Ascodesmis nigricans]